MESEKTYAWEQSRSSAEVIVPLVLKFVKPKSVVDIGCGAGTWLSVFRTHGATSIFGIDAGKYDSAKRVIAEKEYRAHNLETPLNLGRTVDLAVSLEVAEHLDTSAAHIMVDNLVRLAPVILFSAAIPHQGGVHHVNEQWSEYWEKLFASRGYVPVDCIRRHIWNNEKVQFWYKQNTLMYVKKDQLGKYPALKAEIESGHGEALALVHPFKYVYFAERWEAIVPILGRIPPSVLHFGKKMMALIKGRK